MNAQNLINKYNELVEKRGGASFHICILALYNQSPVDYRNKFSELVRKAEADATKFIYTCQDVTSDEYSKFRIQFRNNKVNVKQFYLRRTLQSADHRAIEHSDAAYEAKLFRGLKVVTPADQEVAYLYEDLLRAKHRAVGYSGLQDGEDDYTTVTEFWKTHSLSEDPTPGVMKTPEILKKSIY